MKVDKSIGATGEYPNGKLREDDEGALRMRLSLDRKENVIILDFGTPVKWIGLPPNDAREMATMFLRLAGVLDGTVTSISFGTAQEKSQKGG